MRGVLIASSIVGGACQAEPGVTGGTSTGGPATTTGNTDPGATGEPTTGEPTTGVTTTGVTTTGVTGSSSTASGSGDGTAEGTGGQESSSGEQGSSGGQGSSSGELPDVCGDVDPAVSAKFSLELPGWPDIRGAESIGYFGHCTVDSVMTAGGTVTTEMSCKHENDTLLPATLEIAAAPEGDVIWKVGDKIVLEENAYDDGDGWRVHQVMLRGGPDSALWMVALDTMLGAANVTEWFYSFKVEYAFACEGEPGEERPLRLDFIPFEGPAFSLVDGHRGLMPISDGLGYSIDLARARGTSIEPFAPSDIKVLLRRVAVE